MPPLLACRSHLGWIVVSSLGLTARAVLVLVLVGCGPSAPLTDAPTATSDATSVASGEAAATAGAAEPKAAITSTAEEASPSSPVAEAPGPVLYLRVPHAGNGAEIDRQFARPIMTALLKRDDIRHVASRATRDLAEFRIDLAPGLDVNQALLELVGGLSKEKLGLAQELPELAVSREDPAAEPVLYLVLESETLAARELSAVARAIRARLVTTPGTGVATVVGGVDPVIQIRPDLDRMTAIGRDLVDAWETLEAKWNELGDARSPVELERMIEQTALAEIGGSTVKFRDLASVDITTRPVSPEIVWCDGRPVVAIGLAPRAVADDAGWSQSIAAECDSIRPQLPADCKLRFAFQDAAAAGDLWIADFAMPTGSAAEGSDASRFFTELFAKFAVDAGIPPAELIAIVDGSHASLYHGPGAPIDGERAKRLATAMAAATENGPVIALARSRRRQDWTDPAAPIVIRLRGDDAIALLAGARELTDRLRDEATPHVWCRSTDRATELMQEIDPVRAQDVGLSLDRAQRLLSLISQPKIVGRIRLREEEYSIVLMIDPPTGADSKRGPRVGYRLPNGEIHPFGRLLRTQLADTIEVRERFDGAVAITILAAPPAGMSQADCLAKAQAVVDAFAKQDAAKGLRFEVREDAGP